MQVVTVITDTTHEGFKNYLCQSCDYHELDLTVLEYVDEYFSNRLKDAMLIEHLDCVEDDEIIFFTDATDAFFLCGEKEILEKFNKFDVPLVFSGEINCWPDETLISKYPNSSSKFNYLNSGGFIGKASYLKKIYKKYSINTDDEYTWSNQFYWHHVFINEQRFIKIDYDCNIFFNTAMKLNSLKKFRQGSLGEQNTIIDSELTRIKSEIYNIGSRIQRRNSSSSPCHIHFPGPISKMLMAHEMFDQVTRWSNKN